MSRYRGPKLRIVRRLGKLPGLTQKNCLRHFPPGQHGSKQKSQKPRESRYIKRLIEKQKLRFNYGINEHHLLKYIHQARKQKGSTGEILLQLIEKRLDNIVFRLGFAPTIAAARQLVTHGHILVNQQKNDIPSYICKINDVITVRKTIISLITKFLNSEKSFRVPFFLDLNKEKLCATVTNSVSSNMIELQINELLVLEYYSKKI